MPNPAHRFRPLWKAWFAAHSDRWAPSTSTAYASAGAVLLRYVEPRRIKPCNITRQHILDWVRLAKKEGKSNNRIKHHLRVWSGFFDYIEEDNEIDKNPIQRRHMPHLPHVTESYKPMFAAQHVKLLKELRKVVPPFWRPKYHPDLVTTFMVGYHTGLRFGDAATIKWSEIDFEQEVLRRMPHKTKRFSKTVTIPIDRELMDHLRVKYANREMCDLVSPHAYCRRGHELTDIFRRAGCGGFSFHSYRHGFVSRMMAAGIEPFVIASMTGHSLQSLTTYVTISPLIQAQALEKARSAIHTVKISDALMEPVNI